MSYQKVSQKGRDPRFMPVEVLNLLMGDIADAGLKLLHHKYFDAPATTYTISGLKGDTERFYFIVFRLVNATAAVVRWQFRPNNTTDLQGTKGFGFTGSQHGDFTATEPPFAVWNQSAGYSITGNMTILAKTGFPRVATAFSNRSDAWCLFLGSQWNNTTDEITSLVLTADVANGIGAGSEVWIYGPA